MPSSTSSLKSPATQGQRAGAGMLPHNSRRPTFGHFTPPSSETAQALKRPLHTRGPAPGARAAMRLNLIPFNPAARVDTPKLRQQEITPLDAEQARRFLQAASCEKFEALYVLSLTVGLRCGEALGLKWSDIDLDAGTLRVVRQLQRIREGGGLVFMEPKNASRRTVDLPQRAVEALRSHRHTQVEEEAKGHRLRGFWARVRDGQGHAPRRSEHNQPSFQAPAQARRTPLHPLARSEAHLLHDLARLRHAPDVRPAPRRSRLDTAATRPILPLDALHVPKYCRRDG